MAVVFAGGPKRVWSSILVPREFPRPQNVVRLKVRVEAVLVHLFPVHTLVVLTQYLASA